MIYSGDDDAVCATLGSQQFVWDLGGLATLNPKPFRVEGFCTLLRRAARATGT